MKSLIIAVVKAVRAAERRTAENINVVFLKDKCGILKCDLLHIIIAVIKDVLIMRLDN